jgi:hypothetical protein
MLSRENYLKATRQAGEIIIREFSARMGSDYERQRNFDFGPGKHNYVSRLSPYLRRRLVLESEVVQAALDRHGSKASEKFVQEVFWRTYFKGWLELRPDVWRQYCRGLAEDLSGLQTNPEYRARVEAAEEGRTGLAYFDAWVQELIQTGYLHNHARMWFASIWIFTLGLPWRVGADFFYRHLLDGDAASNTLSWRWVAGLHTRGKAYAAEAGNIERFTGGRFLPALNELRSEIEPLDHTEPEGLPELQKLRESIRPNTALPSVLLITDEDCHIEDFDLTSFSWKAVASIACSQCRSPRKVSTWVVDFERDALADVAQRNRLMPVYFEADSKNNSAEALVDFILQSEVKQVVTPYLTQGPTRDLLESKKAYLETHGIRLCELRRDWDTRIWPHASAGFFKIKQKIPDFLRQMLGADDAYIEAVSP